MKSIFRLLSLLFLLGLTHAGFGQNSGTLSGTVKDQKGIGLDFANAVLLRAADASFVNGTVAGEDGRFSLPAPVRGTYILRVTALGYQALDTAPFTLTGDGITKDLGTFSLKLDAKMLKEVTVESLRPTIVQHPDKTVVGVEGTALAAGNTAYEVLARSPGVFIDQEGNIQLNGKAGVQIMIDGKLTYMSAKELQTFLQGMAAENLKDIELITNPSARFDAEGTSGIININLKKNQLGGLNGSVHGGWQYNGLTGYTGGGNLNFKKGKWSSFVTADMARRTKLRTATMTREFNDAETSDRFDQTGREENFRYTPSLRVGTDYDLTDKHSIGAMANLFYMNGFWEFRTNSVLQNRLTDQVTLIGARNNTNGRFGNGTFNVHYLGKLDTLGTTLSGDLDYVRLFNGGEATFTNTFQRQGEPVPYLTEMLGSTNPSSINIYAAKVDFVKPFSKTTKLELGTKVSHVASENQLRFYAIQDNQQVGDPRRSSHFLYNENIYAAYATYSTKLGPKWSVQGGLRAEQTVAEGRSVSMGAGIPPRNYLDIFPSLFVQQQVSKNYAINYNFSRRINRPRYESLNPFVFYLDPYTWAQGNPLLLPQYTNSFQVTQSLQNKYTLTLGYAKTTNFMAEVPEQNNELNTTVFMQRNVDNYENATATLVAPFKILPKWDTNNTLNVGYQHYSMKLGERDFVNEVLSYSLQSTQAIMLPHGLRMEVNAGYQGPHAYGLYHIAPQWWVDAGLKKNFLQDKLEASLNVTDIFRSRKLYGTANYNGNINEFDQYFGAQSVRLNLRYRFSKGENFEMKKRNTNLEELNRAGGS